MPKRFYRMSCCPVIPPRLRRKPVILRYQPRHRLTGNKTRLRALAGLFKLSPLEVAKSCNVSRCYVSRILSRKDDFTGSPEFYRALELKLGEVIAARTSQFFTVPAVPVARAISMLETELAEAA